MLLEEMSEVIFIGNMAYQKNTMPSIIKRIQCQYSKANAPNSQLFN